jgi:hypothetical protein
LRVKELRQVIFRGERTTFKKNGRETTNLLGNSGTLVGNTMIEKAKCEDDPDYFW